MMAGSRVNAAVDLAWLMVKGRPAIARSDVCGAPELGTLLACARRKKFVLERAAAGHRERAFRGRRVCGVMAFRCESLSTKKG